MRHTHTHTLQDRASARAVLALTPPILVFCIPLWPTTFLSKTKILSNAELSESSNSRIRFALLRNLPELRPTNTTLSPVRARPAQARRPPLLKAPALVGDVLQLRSQLRRPRRRFTPMQRPWCATKCNGYGAQLSPTNRRGASQ